MQNGSNPTTASGQAPPRQPRIIIDLLRGQIRVVPVRARATPSEQRERAPLRPNANGNGNGVAAPRSDDEVKHFIAEVGVGRVQRNIDEMKQPTLPLQAAEVVS